MCSPSVFFGVNPHYLLAVAQFRSKISDDSADGQIGPFQLRQSQWNANSESDEFDLHFTPEQIGSSSRQCAVFGFMAHRAFDIFVSIKAAIRRQRNFTCSNGRILL